MWWRVARSGSVFVIAAKRHRVEWHDHVVNSLSLPSVGVARGTTMCWTSARRGSEWDDRVLDFSTCPGGCQVV